MINVNNIYMPTFTPTLPLERELGKKIYQALQRAEMM